jgi:hypothetical protein
VEVDGDRLRLEADLGRVGTVQARWQQTGAPQNATIRTQEKYMWDLAEMSARLLGAVSFTVGPGTTSSLSVALPSDLEVVAVTANPLRLASPGFAGEGPAVRKLLALVEQPKTLNPSPARTTPGEGEPLVSWLRDWRVDPQSTPGGRRTLVLEFAAPITGPWQVKLELVPRRPFGPAFTLPFPSAVGNRTAAPVFAWRAEGLELVDTPPDSAVPLAAELFLGDYWLPAKVEADAKPPTKAYQRKTFGSAPAVHLRVVPETSPPGK